MLTVLLTGSRVDGLALASQSRALYYTDSHRNEIVMMSVDGKSRKMLKSQNLSSPRAIVVDERSGSVTVIAVYVSRMCLRVLAFDLDLDDPMTHPSGPLFQF